MNEQIRIELLSKKEFIHTFFNATMAYSKCPWIQMCVSAFGKVELPGRVVPILISRSPEGEEILIFRRNRWARASKKSKVLPREMLEKFFALLNIFPTKRNP